MGRLIKTLENKTALIFISLCLLLAAAAFGASYIAVGIAGEQSAIEASDRTLAIAGRLSQNTNLSDDEIASAFAKNSKDEAKEGERILSAYGYEAGSKKGAENYRFKPMLPCITAAVSVLLCAIMGYFCFRHIFKDINSLSYCARRNIKYGDELSDRDIALLAEAVNKLVEQREDSVKRISGEKKYLAEYLQDFSHQIRTPAAGLTLNNEIYRTHRMDNQSMKEYLDRDSICIERINRLCSESLKLARLEAGAVKYEIKECRLADIAQKACAPLYDLAVQSGSKLTIDIPDSLTLNCDEIWFCEALSNLVKNSCEHTKDGRITVSARQTPLSAEIFITDNGEGIPDEDIPQLFRRFSSKRNDRNPSSIGIGMSISKRITEDMGGKMYIDSELGRGTNIRLEFLK